MNKYTYITYNRKGLKPSTIMIPMQSPGPSHQDSMIVRSPDGSQEDQERAHQEQIHQALDKLLMAGYTVSKVETREAFTCEHTLTLQ